MVRELIPDLVLLDIMMPDMDGWEVYQQMRADKATAQIPVIIISARSRPIDQAVGLYVANVADYINKPFHPQLLIDSIEKVLGKPESTG
jgi:two-component system, OmpR family, response regulator VicR